MTELKSQALPTRLFAFDAAMQAIKREYRMIAKSSLVPFEKCRNGYCRKCNGTYNSNLTFPCLEEFVLQAIYLMEVQTTETKLQKTICSLKDFSDASLYGARFGWAENSQLNIPVTAKKGCQPIPLRHWAFEAACIAAELVIVKYWVPVHEYFPQRKYVRRESLDASVGGTEHELLPTLYGFEVSESIPLYLNNKRLIRMTYGTNYDACNEEMFWARKEATHVRESMLGEQGEYLFTKPDNGEARLECMIILPRDEKNDKFEE